MKSKYRFMDMVVLSAVLSVLVFAGTSPSQEREVGGYTERVATTERGEISFDMAFIPGGTFRMGSVSSEEGRAEDEGPQHEAPIKPFYLCTTETTMGLFLAYYYETYTARKNVERAGLDAITGPTPVYGELSMGYSMKYPAFAMTWHNAVNFCKWLSKRTGKEYRLASEAEWEYAARAGTERAYPFEDNPEKLGDYAWYEENSDFEPHEVATKKANAWGLYDMLGNVQEWVHDFYSPTAYEQPIRQGPADGKVHVARGGYYDSNAAEVRCAARGFEEGWWRMNDPQLPKSKWWLPQMDHVGFRIARSVDVTSEPGTLGFTADGAGGYTFDTGTLRGKICRGGASFGLTSVTDLRSGARIDRGAGILSYYRIFSANKRYGNAAFEWPSSAVLQGDGALQVTWPSTADRPFELSGTYRWRSSSTLDVETTVKANEELKDFEVFLASYFDKAFASPYMCVGEIREGESKSVLRLVSKEAGEWQMFGRDDAAVSLIRDGRWKIEPHPVDWADTVRMGAPLCVRRSGDNGPAVVVMAPEEDCFAISSPYEGESHYSLYLSLFGRDIEAGQSAKVRSRFVVTTRTSDGEILDIYRKYREDLAGRTETQGAEGVRVLIVTGIDYPGHLWKETSPVLKKALEQDKRLSVDIVEEPEYLASEELGQYDTIVLHFMNWERPDPGKKAQQGLRKFVEDGGGLVLVHFACGAFQGWDEFEKIAGRVWDPEKRPHDPYGRFTVNITGKAHPITRGLSDFETVDELYTCLVGDTPVEVLASAVSKVDKKVYPMAFVFNYGKGRVFHCLLGHDVQAIANPGVAQLYRRGCAWTAGLEPVEQKNVVFIAGKNSHDASSHRHTEGLKFFKKCLDSSPNVTGIKTIYVFEDELYKKPDILDTADTIVIYSDGFENHPLANKDVFEKVDKLMKKGVGFVCIHFATAPPKDKDVESAFLGWLGGMYQDGYSKNPVEWNDFIFALPEHPVVGGCENFSAKDEFYYCLRFNDGGRNVTPLLTISKPDENPSQQVVAWVYERPDGGRSFGTSGGHFHKNWQIESLRRMMLNAIVWTARANVPANGVESGQ